ncbi:hypothetical protein HA466_0258100 [Hirschfeldia incana]|nr:hypothetical protein HA466_0258100 [Hirschfeldia incana]
MEEPFAIIRPDLSARDRNYGVTIYVDLDTCEFDRSCVLQQGGTFVFRGKKLVYGRKDEGAGDHPSLDDVINVCCQSKTTVA